MLPRIDEEITFRKLEILLAFMESGNLARAAELLGVSAVSVGTGFRLGSTVTAGLVAARV